MTNVVVFGVEIVALIKANVLFGIVITNEVTLPVTVIVPLDSFAAKISATIAALIAVNVEKEILLQYFNQQTTS